MTVPSARDKARTWKGSLELRYAHRDGRTTARDRHEGPLRVLKALYPDGPACCEHTLVHPPGGLAGGDELQVTVTLEPGAQAVITTPGATRFYRSSGAQATQAVVLTVGEGARLEWLPLETLAYPGCLASNRVRFDLAQGAQMIGWDLLALGLPAAEAPFDSGRIEQSLAWPGVWLEQGHISSDDVALLDGPAGLAGYRVLGTMWCASGSPWDSRSLGSLLDAAREVLPAHRADALAGATAPDPRLVAVRMLAHRVEPVFEVWRQVRRAWRRLLWQCADSEPRIWRM